MESLSLCRRGLPFRSSSFVGETKLGTFSTSIAQFRTKSRQGKQPFARLWVFNEARSGSQRYLLSTERRRCFSCGRTTLNAFS
jgi:hypothetical protein